jgi:PPOX class probable F420-dependent enzyme
MTTPTEPLERLDAAKYLLVTTFRRDGRAVATPVWKVRDGDALGIWTATDSGKVKRIRNRADVRLAPCTSRGKPLGEEVSGHAEILDVEGMRRYRRRIARVYWLTGPWVVLFSKLRRGDAGTVGIRITLS